VNFLAHLFLAGNHPEQHVGAVMGDFLREVDRDLLSPILKESVRHHLAVDSFTDSHSDIHQLKRLFSKGRQRFSGIIIDITFDHFLYTHWDTFSSEPVNLAIHSYYRSLKSNQSTMPPRMKHVTALLVQHDILNSYQSLNGIGTALNRVADRLSRKTALYGAIDEVRLHHLALEDGFLNFFPELVAQFGNGQILTQ